MAMRCKLSYAVAVGLVVGSVHGASLVDAASGDTCESLAAAGTVLKRTSEALIWQEDPKLTAEFFKGCLIADPHAVTVGAQECTSSGCLTSIAVTAARHWTLTTSRYDSAADDRLYSITLTVTDLRFPGHRQDVLEVHLAGADGLGNVQQTAVNGRGGGAWAGLGGVHAFRPRHRPSKLSADVPDAGSLRLGVDKAQWTVGGVRKEVKLPRTRRIPR